MPIYKALDKRGWFITTVIAENEEAARREVERQLNRPGRCGYFRQWVEAGRLVVESEAYEAGVQARVEAVQAEKREE